MNITQLLHTLTPIVEVLERLNVPYYIGGSVVSSFYGETRPTQDVDIVADMQPSQVRPFVKLLEDDYYVVEDSIRDAIRRRGSFNLISNVTFLKVDIFILKSRAFDQDSLRSLRQQPLVKGGREFVLASPENTIVNKLEWYRIGGEVSNRQWNDLIGVLKTQGTALDLAYLDRWATALGVSDLLERALVEARLR
ncbi:MAG: hypothetical protein JO125_08930 [Chloroflexi bacterium]|nr:hypothetical protein [Ktedonobacteraceae bacterium]MBV9707516.1 hypothetical protein [Chloroflexota bacterium]